MDKDGYLVGTNNMGWRRYKVVHLHLESVRKAVKGTTEHRK
jgi:hypothetical protein